MKLNINQFEANLCSYFLLKPNNDFMALMAFSLINDSSNFFRRGSNSSDALRLARSGSVRILFFGGKKKKSKEQKQVNRSLSYKETKKKNHHK